MDILGVLSRKYLGLGIALASLCLVSCVSAKPANAISDTSSENCQQKYTQVYQPPLKLGGAGRVIQVASGLSCDLIAGKETKEIEANYIRQAKFTSLPAGAVIVVHKQDKNSHRLAAVQRHAQWTWIIKGVI